MKPKKNKKDGVFSSEAHVFTEATLIRPSTESKIDKYNIPPVISFNIALGMLGKHMPGWEIVDIR